MKNKLTYRLALLLMMAGLASAATAGESVSLQPGMDRMGADYNAFALDQADPQICRKACADDAVCKSYSYVKPGVKGDKAMCYLKSSAVPATANACCTSGAKTTTLATVPFATSKNPAAKPSLKMTPNLTNAADPQQLLKQVNELKAQNAAQQETIAELASLVAQARNDIQALKAYDEIAKGGISYINSSQQSFQKKFTEFKTNEYAKHYHVTEGVVGNGIGPGGVVLLLTDPPKLSKIANIIISQNNSTSAPIVVE